MRIMKSSSEIVEKTMDAVADVIGFYDHRMTRMDAKITIPKKIAKSNFIWMSLLIKKSVIKEDGSPTRHEERA